MVCILNVVDSCLVLSHQCNFSLWAQGAPNQRGGESFSRKRDRAKLLRQQMNDGLDNLHEVSIYTHLEGVRLEGVRLFSPAAALPTPHLYPHPPAPVATPPMFSRNTWYRVLGVFELVKPPVCRKGRTYCFFSDFFDIGRSMAWSWLLPNVARAGLSPACCSGLASLFVGKIDGSHGATFPGFF